MAGFADLCASAIPGSEERLVNIAGGADLRVGSSVKEPEKEVGVVPKASKGKMDSPP
jgi:hypothetical protein